MLEQMAGPSKTESGGGGYLALANPIFRNAVGGGKNPRGGGLRACALRPKGVEFGFLASFFSTPLNNKKTIDDGRR